MKKIIQFGERVEGYDIPVLNEREIRASAGILFLGAFISLVLILTKGNFLPIKYFIMAFLVDLLVRVLVNPQYSPSLIIGRMIVRNQTPEYVGAAQKRFAWIIGIAIAGLMFVFLVLLNAYSLITGSACIVCLIFLFFEASFGICLGCKFYSLFYRKKAKYCPGEICDVKYRQKVSLVQVLIVLVFIAGIVASVFLLNVILSKPAHDFFK